jgi:hypothetical protein
MTMSELLASNCPKVAKSWVDKQTNVCDAIVTCFQ